MSTTYLMEIMTYHIPKFRNLSDRSEIILAALPASAPTIIKASGIHKSVVFRHLIALHDAKKIHITGWESHSKDGRGPPSAIYSFGPGIDAEYIPNRYSAPKRMDLLESERRVLAAMPGFRNELSKRANLSPTTVCKIVTRMVALGHATVSGSKPPFLYTAV